MILLTGGTGYIGSHTALELLKKNKKIVLFDNLSNSSEGVVSKLEYLTQQDIPFVAGDILSKKDLSVLFDRYKITSVIHFAGLKSVKESMVTPFDYYNTNVSGALNLIEVMQKNNCKKIIFSSSATVYGEAEKGNKQKETDNTSPENPYGRSKLVVENILKDLYLSDNSWAAISLRYFNPIGSDISGMLNESPKTNMNNIMPVILEVLQKKRDCLEIYGDDYDTIDGTGVRDYIHVTDLAKGHVKALDNLEQYHTINLGTGKGYSVLQIIKIFNRLLNEDIPYKIVEKRSGDVGTYLADPSYAKNFLEWESELNMDRMCSDVIRAHLKN